jgi:hypothetical protein
MRVTNLLNLESIIIERRDGGFHLRPDQISVSEGTEFCLIEASLD